MTQPAIPSPPDAKRSTETGIRIGSAFFGAILCIIAGYLSLGRTGSSLVAASYDLPFLSHRAGGAGNIRLVYLSELDGSLLDRKVQAGLLDRLNEAGAMMVIYDVIFNEPSKDPKLDEEFAAAMRRFRGVDAEGNRIPGQYSRQILLACERKTFQVTGAVGEQLVTPNDTLLDAADDFGVVAVDDDAYLIRKLPTGTRDEPSLIWKSAIAAGAKLDEADRSSPRWLNFAGPPPDPEDPNSVPAIPSADASAVLSGFFNPGFFRNKIVLVGGEPGILGAELGKDLFATPFHRFQIGGKLPLMSGVEMQGNGLANLLQGNWIVRSERKFDLVLVVAAGLLLGIGFTLLRPVKAVMIALALVIAGAGLGTLSVHYSNFWFPWTVVAFLQVPVALGWGVASQSYIERFFRIRLTKEQVAMRAAFAKYLSPQMLDRLTREGFTTNLGGEKVHAAMMFTDLEDFTNLCERIGDPERILATLNHYFERTTGSIFDDEGVIIKFIGDAIFAAWGAPLPDPASPNKAVHAAWNLFTSDKLVVDGETLKTRIGLHYGEVVAGNAGSSRRMDYTLMGDSVNLAARLEGINKMLDTNILMSEAVRRHIDSSFRIRKVGCFRVKGRREPVEIHELLGPALQQEEPKWIGLYHRALADMEAGRKDDALAGFRMCHSSRAGGDGPARYMIGVLETTGVAADGIVNLTEK